MPGFTFANCPKSMFPFPLSFPIIFTSLPAPESSICLFPCAEREREREREPARPVSYAWSLMAWSPSLQVSAALVPGGSHCALLWPRALADAGPTSSDFLGPSPLPYA